MESPLVSIIVPVYNTEEYVDECIQSILSQSYKDIELILVNDGSTDGSGKVCRKFIYLSNVYFIEQVHMGTTAARKRGIEEAHGDWVMFVDSDDVIIKEAVNNFLSASEGVDIVVGRISDAATLYPPVMTREEYINMMYEKKVSSSPCAKLFRKSLFNEKTLCFDRKVCRWEDWLMNLQIAKDNTAPVNTISEAVYYYRKRLNSTSHTNVLSYNELEYLCSIADMIVSDEFKSMTAFRKAKIENRLRLFQHELLLNGFHNEPNHPFIKDIKRCMNEAGVWKPFDRCLLSVSSPWAVKAAWNLKKVWMRLKHPSMIIHDVERLLCYHLCCCMNMKQKIWRIIRPVARPMVAVAVVVVFYLLRVFPVNKKKVIVSVFSGSLYDDNQRYIMDELHKLCPDLDIVWVKNPKYDYELPEWIRPVKLRSWRWLYEYATARIWTNNSIVPDYFIKRKGQLYVETWHGGLGIKKLKDDAIGDRAADRNNTLFLKNASNMADVFISNSDHLSVIYRRAFKFQGSIWKCGYPKNDMLVQNNPEEGQRARIELGIPMENKVLLYAPTWRLRFIQEQHIDMKVFDLDMKRLKKALIEKFGGKWTMLIRFHSLLRQYAKGYQATHPNVMDVTDYQDMQRLLMATDVMVSDYSSCIFDVALRRIPCLTYATDLDQYKYEERGVYYEMEELPFPYAKNNDEMEQNVRAFDKEDYLKKWDAFAIRMGLNETGHAAKDIAEKMADFLNGKEVSWNNDYPIQK